MAIRAIASSAVLQWRIDSVPTLAPKRPARDRRNPSPSESPPCRFPCCKRPASAPTSSASSFAAAKRYPLVLMLEPLFRCNLACAGCGKIDYPEEILNQRLSVDDCLKAVDECGAPVVSIAGGEPLLHKEIDAVVAGIIARRKFVYLCTNALLMKKRLSLFKPSPYFVWSVHLDGDREMHDRSVCEDGRLRPRGRGDQGGQGAGLPRQHQLHAVQRRRSGARRAVLRQRRGARCRRHHRVAGLCVRARARPGALPQPREDQAAVPRHLPPRPRRQGVVVQPIGTVPRFPGRQPGIPVHAVGQSDAHGLRLAASLLPAGRRLRARPSAS